MEMIEKLSLAGIVPVIKVEDAADAVPLCKALSDGGLPVAEITFRTPAAEESIRRVSAELPDVILGAGTVLTVDQAKRAVVVDSPARVRQHIDGVQCRNNVGPQKAEPKTDPTRDARVLPHGAGQDVKRSVRSVDPAAIGRGIQRNIDPGQIDLTREGV